MKKFKLIAIISAIGIAGFASSLLAASEAEDKLLRAGQAANFSDISLPSAIGGVIGAILSVIGIIFMAYIIYGGWLWLSAAGNDEKITKAKKTIRDGIIGLIIALSAYAITYFVVNQFTEAGSYYDQSATTATQ